MPCQVTHLPLAGRRHALSRLWLLLPNPGLQHHTPCRACCHLDVLRLLRLLVCRVAGPKVNAVRPACTGR
jgi:hypothetical protein